jgi:hypothetical protein
MSGATANDTTTNNTTINNTTTNNTTTNNATTNNATTNNATTNNATINNATTNNAMINNATTSNATTNNATTRNRKTNNATTRNRKTNNATTRNRKTNNATTRNRNTNNATTNIATTNNVTANYATANYATTSYATANYATANYATTSYATPSYATTSYATTSYATTSYATTNYAITSYATTNYAITNYATTNNATTNNATTNNATTTSTTNILNQNTTEQKVQDNDFTVYQVIDLMETLLPKSLSYCSDNNKTFAYVQLKNLLCECMNYGIHSMENFDPAIKCVCEDKKETNASILSRICCNIDTLMEEYAKKTQILEYCHRFFNQCIKILTKTHSSFSEDDMKKEPFNISDRFVDPDIEGLIPELAKYCNLKNNNFRQLYYFLFFSLNEGILDSYFSRLNHKYYLSVGHLRSYQTREQTIYTIVNNLIGVEESKITKLVLCHSLDRLLKTYPKVNNRLPGNPFILRKRDYNKVDIVGAIPFFKDYTENVHYKELELLVFIGANYNSADFYLKTEQLNKFFSCTDLLQTIFFHINELLKEKELPEKIIEVCHLFGKYYFANLSVAHPLKIMRLPLSTNPVSIKQIMAECNEEKHHNKRQKRGHACSYNLVFLNLNNDSEDDFFKIWKKHYIQYDGTQDVHNFVTSLVDINKNKCDYPLFNNTQY